MAALADPDPGPEQDLAGALGPGRPLAAQAQPEAAAEVGLPHDRHRHRDPDRAAAEQFARFRAGSDRVGADPLLPRGDDREADVEAVVGAGGAVLEGDVGTRVDRDLAEFVELRPRLAGAAADIGANRGRGSRDARVVCPAGELHLARQRRADRFQAAAGFGRRRGNGADGGAFDVVVVDVDRDAAVALVVAAAVLVDPLVLAPGGIRDVGVVGVFLPVPVGDPEVVGLGVGAADPGAEVGDAGGAGAVDAGLVAGRVQLGGPGGEEGQGGAAVGGGARVALHVEVDRAAGADPEQARLLDRVFGLFGALGGGGAAAEDGARRAAAAGCLQTDVGRDQVPARGDLFAHPAGGQVGLGAATVLAADVDADRPVGRVLPGVHRLR